MSCSPLPALRFRAKSSDGSNGNFAARIDLRAEVPMHGGTGRPFTEQHRRHSISDVRKGSFGCRTRGRLHELIAGSILVGHPGDEYMRAHGHHGCGGKGADGRIRRHGRVRRTIEMIGSQPPWPAAWAYNSAGLISGTTPPRGPQRVRSTLAADSTPSTTIDAAASMKK